MPLKQLRVLESSCGNSLFYRSQHGHFVIALSFRQNERVTEQQIHEASDVPNTTHLGDLLHIPNTTQTSFTLGTLNALLLSDAGLNSA